MNRNILVAMVLMLILGMALTACGSKTESKATQPPATQPPATQPPATQPPTIQPTTAPTSEDEGQALLNVRCTKCHNLDRVTSKNKSAEEWAKTVTRMIKNGAKLTADEQIVLVAYLAKTYAP